MDFLRIGTKTSKKQGKEEIIIFPKFIAKKSKDLMIRGGDFYAIWNEATGLWSTNQDDVIDMVDKELLRFRESNPKYEGAHILFMWDADSGMIDKWHKYVQRQMVDNYHPLDERIIFMNSDVKKEDYASKRLPYVLSDVDECPAWNELVSTLYSPEERMKIEWAIGSVVSGESKYIQKFLVLYGSAGTGKSTILNVIQLLFDGYYSMFDAKALGSSSDSFALEAFKNNPLVAIQHDGDLSRIEDNTRLNSVVSHELMTVNEKFKTQYTSRFQAMLFMGTNKPVKITDSKSGIIRRLIDVSPSEKKIPQKRYFELVEQIRFELGGIARHCLNVFKDNRTIFDSYVPLSMMSETNDFYNFMEENYYVFNSEEQVTLYSAWEMYKEWCKEANISYPLLKRVFKNELKGYFKEYSDRGRDSNGCSIYNVYRGFRTERFHYISENKKEDSSVSWLNMEELPSIVDSLYSDCKAQYANSKGTPKKKWDDVDTYLSDLDTHQLHYILFSDEYSNHIVVDFDIKDSKGNKSYKLNYEEARKWPETYAELSKSGEGIHLHYIYDGDVSKLSSIVKEDVEVKVFTGNSSLRRKLTKCNDIPIRTINSGLPLKKGENMLRQETIKNEQELRRRIAKCLRKEHHGSTTPEVYFLVKILDDAHSSGIHYDVSDMEPAIIAFANNSTNQAKTCLKLIDKMKFKSDDILEAEADNKSDKPYTELMPLVFFDVEVFPNFFGVVWKTKNGQPVKMMNPTPTEIEELLRYNLIGFNNRRYDNHILYARILGYSNERLYKLSQDIISGKKNAMFGNAYNLSYTDIYDFSAKKQSLKKWEIELGIHHQELGLKWDEPVPQKLWHKVMDYCVNDVIATEAVFEHLHQDFIAREILADITGLSVNDTTNSCTTKLIVGGDKNPQEKFVYTDLSEMFPGYVYYNGESMYRGEKVGEGGYVYAEPGVYRDVALLDIQSMHPNSAIALNIFGPYTKNFEELVHARIFVKHGEYDKASKLFGGKLAPYLEDPAQAKALAYALKIAINSVYGLTAAKFENRLKDPRNIDNIVAKRGALFMVDLKHAVQERGFTVAHIKTDSIKIPNATKEIIGFVMEFGKKYGYIFEHEDTYERMCLVNDAVYIAKSDSHTEHGGWTATGTQFKVPYVFKSLFSKEPIEFTDLCETKSVTTSLYLDMNEELNTGEHDYRFVGKVGQFCPIKDGCNGGVLLREKNGKYYAATGSKGYRWLEAERVEVLNKQDDIDISFYENMASDARKTIEEFVNFEEFVS